MRTIILPHNNCLLYTSEKKSCAGLNTVIVEDIDNAGYRPVDLAHTEILWLFGKNKHPDETPGWNGYMQKIKNSQDYATLKIITVLFVNAPPSDFNTIFTVLIEASQRSIAQGQKACVVTFDQPLYYKAMEIVSSIDPNNDPYQIPVSYTHLDVYKRQQLI